MDDWTKAERQIAEDYEESLKELVMNSKPHINMLTMLAEENMEYAPIIVEVIQKQIRRVGATHKLPIMYLIDSIMKNIKQDNDYKSAFQKIIIGVFSHVFQSCDEKTRASLYKLRCTWNGFFPPSKLYGIDISVREIDHAWPISQPDKSSAAAGGAAGASKTSTSATAAGSSRSRENVPAVSSSTSEPSTTANNKIHVNPKFLPAANTNVGGRESGVGVGGKRIGKNDRRNNNNNNHHHHRGNRDNHRGTDNRRPADSFRSLSSFSLFHFFGSEDDSPNGGKRRNNNNVMDTAEEDMSSNESPAEDMHNNKHHPNNKRKRHDRDRSPRQNDDIPRGRGPVGKGNNNGNWRNGPPSGISMKKGNNVVDPGNPLSGTSQLGSHAFVANPLPSPAASTSSTLPLQPPVMPQPPIPPPIPPTNGPPSPPQQPFVPPSSASVNNSNAQQSWNSNGNPAGASRGPLLPGGPPAPVQPISNNMRPPVPSGGEDVKPAIPANNRIFVDGRAYEVQYIEDIPVIERNGVPHKIYFTGPSRDVVIDGVPHNLAFGDRKTVNIDGQSHVIRFGAPSRELYMGNYAFRGAFGGPPIYATINGQRHEISLCGPPPEVKIEPEPAYELARFMQGNQAQARGPVYDYSSAQQQHQNQIGGGGPPMINNNNNNNNNSNNNNQSGGGPFPAGGPFPNNSQNYGGNNNGGQPMMNNNNNPNNNYNNNMGQTMMMTNQFGNNNNMNMSQQQPQQQQQPSSSSDSKNSGGGRPTLPDTVAGIDLKKLLTNLKNSGILPAINKASAAGPNKSPERETTPPIRCQYGYNEGEEVERRSNPPTNLKDFSIRVFRIRFDSVINNLYKTKQRCPNCGLRFEDTEGMAYKRHMDWHFKENQNDQSTKSRGWFLNINDWIDFSEHEQEDPSSASGPSALNPGGDSNSNHGTDLEGLQTSYPPVLATDISQSCSVCAEEFGKDWDDDDEIWILSDCIQVDGRLFHKNCFADASLVASTPTPTASDSTPFLSSGDGLPSSLHRSGLPGLSVKQEEVKQEEGEEQEGGEEQENVIVTQPFPPSTTSSSINPSQSQSSVVIKTETQEQQ